MNLEVGDLYFDYSKNRLTPETITLLVALARRAGVEQLRDAMFAGEKINITEQRAVLHIALRSEQDETIMVDGVNVVTDVHRVLNKMSVFSNRVRTGAWTGHTGKRIRNVVNVGIGGSDLGPRMATTALARLLRAVDDVPLRLERRRHGFLRGDAGPRPRRDAVHHRLEDLHHARDDDQRAHGA